MRSLIAPIILLALAACCGVLSLHVEPVGWRGVSLDAPLPVGPGVSRYAFAEPDGGYHSIALRMNDRSGQLHTACVFLPDGEATLSKDPNCTKPGASVPIKLSWQLLDGGNVAASGHFATGDYAGSFLGDDPAIYLLGGQFQLRRRQRYTLVLGNETDLSALAAANPRLVVLLMETAEGPLIVQVLEQLGAFILGLAGAVWGMAALIIAYRCRRRVQPEPAPDH